MSLAVQRALPPGRVLITDQGAVQYVTDAGVERFELVGCSCTHSAMAPKRLAAPSSHVGDVIRLAPNLLETVAPSFQGTEQVFTVTSDAVPRSRLVLDMRFSGALSPHLERGTVAFRDARGNTDLRYGGWKAWDARHHPLSMAFDLKGSDLQVVLDDRGATFPVTIDPVFYQTQLDAPVLPFGTLGLAVAISDDGATIAVSAYNANVGLVGEAGQVYVFRVVSGAWTKIAEFDDPTASSEIGNIPDLFGGALALSADGNVLLIGAAHLGPPGQAYIYTETGGSWKQTAEFDDPGKFQSDFFGHSVALSRDGTVAAIGATYASVTTPGVATLWQGKAYLYKQQGEKWSQVQELDDPNAASGLSDRFGSALALSQDGGVLLVGTVYNAYSYSLVGGMWVQESVINDPNPIQIPAGSGFGSSLTLTPDGTQAFIGAQYANSNTTSSSTAESGKAYLFSNSGGTWTESQEFDDPNAPGATFQRFDDYFGGSVAMSDDGTVLAVGSYNGPVSAASPGASGPGVAYLYTLSGGQWRQSAMFTDPANTAGDYYGIAVALSGAGDQFVVGADVTSLVTPSQGAVIESGAAYVYGSSEDLSLSEVKSVASLEVGQTLQYSYNVTNEDTGLASPGVTVMVDLPPLMTYVSSTQRCNTIAGVLNCYLGTLAAGATVPLSITLRGASAGSTTMSASVYSSDVDPQLSNNSVTATLTVTAVPGTTGGKSGGGAMGWLSLLMLSSAGILRKRRQ